MVEPIDFVFCPIRGQDIDIGECIDIQNVVDNAVIENVIDFQLSSNDKKICQRCKKRIDPSL